MGDFDIYDRMWETEHGPVFPLVYYKKKGLDEITTQTSNLEVFINLLDPDLASHSKRVGMFAIKIGEFFGLSRTDMHAYKLTGLAHDVGKLTHRISPILRKQIEVDPDVFRDARAKHVILGNSLLQVLGTKFPPICFQVLQEHHEDWDGGGYPRGIKGDQISINAQIFRYADAFDSATSNRRATREQCSEPFDHKRHIMVHGNRFMRGIDPSHAIYDISQRIGTRFSPNIREAFNKFTQWYFDIDINQFYDPRTYRIY